jgi:hypothetical protein
MPSQLALRGVLAGLFQETNLADTHLAGRALTRPVTRWGLLTVQGLTRAKAEWGKAIAPLN